MMEIVDKFARWRNGGPINRSLAETALRMSEAHKTYMECATVLTAEMKQRKDDMDAAHARISALQAAPKAVE